MDVLKNDNLFSDYSKSIAGEYIKEYEYPYMVLKNIGDIIKKIGETLSPDEYDHPKDNVWIAKDANVLSSAYLGENIIICSKAEVRHCAFIRSNAIIGCGSVVGNSTELKNVIIFDSVQVPHYNYVGDSILGYKSHMGAGSITSNVKSDKTLVTISCNGEKVETGLKKMGAILGDFVEVGCNSVLNPGTVVGRCSNIYPLSMVRGYVPENSIYKNKNEVVFKNNL